MKDNMTFGRLLLAAILLAGAGSFCMAQNAAAKMGKIAILPFTGGTQDENDGIAELFSFKPDITANFDILPRTNITSAVQKEQRFQSSSGMTDADTIAKLGNQFGAEYVMAGSITRLGRAKLLIVSIIKIDVIQQVAGDFLTYNSLDVLVKNQDVINTMAGKLVALMTEQDTASLDKLAVLPVQFTGDVNTEEGDALAQLLSIHLLRNGKYAVFPRTTTLDMVQDEYKTQHSGITSDREAVTLGRAVNPQYVLSVASRRIGSSNIFNGSIIDLEHGTQVAGNNEQYANLTDGMSAMDFLARVLSGEKVSEKERNQRTTSVTDSEQEAADAVRRYEKDRLSQERRERFLKNSGIGLYGMFIYGIPVADMETQSTGGGGGFECVLDWFSIQSGITVYDDVHKVENSGKATEFSTMVCQIPILAKGSIHLGSIAILSVYSGVGINVVSTDAESFAPLSFIAGLELHAPILFDGKLRLGVGLEYGLDLAETSASLLNGNDFTYRGSRIDLTAKLSYFFPFRE